MFRQLIVFVPAMIVFPMMFGIRGVWFAQLLVDFVIIAIGVMMMIRAMKNMGKEEKV